MDGTPLHRSQEDDPRRLRELLHRAADIASDHDISSVVVGMSGPTGDQIFPEVVDFVASALRMDDAIVRMTRERVVLFLADADVSRAQDVMERVLKDFIGSFPTPSEPVVRFGYYEVAPGATDVSVKQILPALF